MRVLVVGAGIGGLAAAVGLQRAGHEVVVFERAAALAELPAGGGFHLWVNSMRALQALHLAEQAEGVGAPIEQTEFWSSAGRLLGVWPVGQIGRAFDVVNLGVRRKDLHHLLAETVGDGAVRTGARCTAVEQGGDGVTVHLADRSSEHGDLLIGADGIRSTVRSQLWGERPARYAGYTQFQGIIAASEDALPAGVERVVFGRGARVVLHHVGADRHLFWACIVYGPPRGRGRTGNEKAVLQERFAGWPPPIGAVITATPEPEITWVDVYDRPPFRSWGQGRVTLLGDAAHPMTTNLGQGASQALDDAVVLVDCLARLADAPAALRAYEARRSARTAPLVKQSWRIARLGSLRGPFTCAVRDVIFRFALPGPGLRQHRKDMALAP